MESEQEKKIVASLVEEVAFGEKNNGLELFSHDVLPFDQGTCLCCDVSSSTKVASLRRTAFLTRVGMVQLECGGSDAVQRRG